MAGCWLFKCLIKPEHIYFEDMVIHFEGMAPRFKSMAPTSEIMAQRHAKSAWLEHCKVPMILKILKSIFFLYFFCRLGHLETCYKFHRCNPSRCIKASFYVSKKKLDFPITKGFRRNISMKLFQIMFTNSWQFSLIYHPVILPILGCL